MNDCMSTQYKLSCRRILEFLRSELGLAGCFVYHNSDENGVVEFIAGNIAGVVEGDSNASLDSISYLVRSGGCNRIVPDCRQSLYAEHGVFQELNPVAIVAMPLTNIDGTQESIVGGVSFEPNKTSLSGQRSLLEFCASQLDQVRTSFLQRLDDSLTIEMLTEQAYQDSMTGLFNRNGWEAAIAAAIANGFSKNVSVSVFVVDVNNLKALNDTQGHAAGDEVIRQVAKSLKKYFETQSGAPHVQNESFVARTGGDEYMGLLYDCDDETALTVSASISEELLAKGVSVSVGFASCRSSRRLSTAIENADEAMYLRKAQINEADVQADTKLKLTG